MDDFQDLYRAYRSTERSVVLEMTEWAAIDVILVVSPHHQHLRLFSFPLGEAPSYRGRAVLTSLSSWRGQNSPAK